MNGILQQFQPLPPSTEEEVQRVARDQRRCGYEVNMHNLRQTCQGERWANDEYMVYVVVRGDADNGKMTHLSIKRNDRQPIHDWRDMQEIKNAFVGREAEAVELYPAESRLVDATNQYHLWCLEPGECFPFGFTERLVESELPKGVRMKQRPRSVSA